MAVNRHVVTVRRYQLDRFGDRQLLATFQVGGCIFAPRSTSEDNDRSTTVEADAELYVPAYAGIEASDEVEFEDGTAYQVNGQPERWESPWSNWAPPDVVSLKRKTG
ncbi:hypothetical protein [Amycolatopsis kentuckyensis]|uniref:hypothetical protein n=1 Tax=Amycolatopsis kentuckyensis TaxID=218823 RepID=UPI00356AFB53